MQVYHIIMLHDHRSFFCKIKVIAKYVHIQKVPIVIEKHLFLCFSVVVCSGRQVQIYKYPSVICHNNLIVIVFICVSTVGKSVESLRCTYHLPLCCVLSKDFQCEFKIVLIFQTLLLLSYMDEILFMEELNTIIFLSHIWIFGCGLFLQVMVLIKLLKFWLFIEGLWNKGC